MTTHQWLSIETPATPWHRLVERVREWIMDLTSGIDNRLSDWQWCGNPKDVNWRDRVTWFVTTHITGRLFCLAFHGSDSELRTIFDGETPLGAANERQLAAVWYNQPEPTECGDCHWIGSSHDVRPDGTCPACSSTQVYIPYMVSR